MTTEAEDPPDGARIEGVLGRGASAQVVLVRFPDGERRVRKRILVGEGWNDGRIQREIDTLRKLEHPNLVRLLAVRNTRHHVELEFPYLAGETLKDRIRRGPLPPEVAAARVAELCAALAAMHAHGVVHRDVKPANVLLAGDGRAVLLDLGLVTDPHAEARLTETGAIPCTPAYAAPEYLVKAHASPASDLYSVGILAFEALTGRHPFGRDLSFHAMIQHHLSTPAPSLRDLQAGVTPLMDSLCRQLLAKDPDVRPASASAASRAWAAAAGHRTVAGPAGDTPSEADTVELSEGTQRLPAPISGDPPRSTPSPPPGPAEPADHDVSALVRSAALEAADRTSSERTPSDPRRRPPGRRLDLRAAGASALLVLCGAGVMARWMSSRRASAPIVAPVTPAAPVEGEAAPPAGEVAALEALRDWLAEADPAAEYDPLEDADPPGAGPALRALRALEAPCAPRTLEALRALEADAGALGLPPVLAAFVPAETPPATRGSLAGSLSAFGLPVPEAALSSRPALEAAGAILVAHARTEALAQKVAEEGRGAAPMRLLALASVAKGIPLDGWWAALHAMPSLSDRRSLARQARPALRATLGALRAGLEAAAELGVGAGEPGRALALWVGHEAEALRGALGLSSLTLNLSDLSWGTSAEAIAPLRWTLLRLRGRLLRSGSLPLDHVEVPLLAALRRARAEPGDAAVDLCWRGYAAQVEGAILGRRKDRAGHESLMAWLHTEPGRIDAASRSLLVARGLLRFSDEWDQLAGRQREVRTRWLRDHPHPGVLEWDQAVARLEG